MKGWLRDLQWHVVSQPLTEGKKAAKVGKTEHCLGMMEYRKDEPALFLNTPYIRKRRFVGSKYFCEKIH